MVVNLEMWLGVIAFVLVPLLVLIGARAVAVRASGIAGSGLAGRARRTLDVALKELGTIPSALIVVLAGVAATIASMWVLGKGAHALQGRVDWPVWRWFGAHQDTGWTNTWWHITSMGSPLVTQRLVMVGAVVMFFVWRKRVWWLPPVVLILGYVSEKYGQIILKLVVHRGHPPHAAEKFGAIAQTFGTWPSGGCARVLVVYGLITYLAVRVYRNGRSRGAWVFGAAFVSLALTVQAYARLNDMEHWITDVVGGTIFGVLLLSLMIGGAEIVQYGRSRAKVAPAHNGTATGRVLARESVASTVMAKAGARD
jgi:hypothetical protein